MISLAIIEEVREGLCALAPTPRVREALGVGEGAPLAPGTNGTKL